MKLMKTIKPLIIATAFAILATTTGEAQDFASHELEIINQLSSKVAVANMPVSQLLNASGNEALKAFFFTPVKDTTALRGKRIAVIAADGFEEIEMLGPVWYFRSLGAKIDVVAPKYNPAPARYGLSTPEIA